MVGVLTVWDFRESDSWSIARSVACAIFELNDSWSKTIKSRTLGRQVERLSVALLDEIAKGYEGSGDPAFLAQAGETVDRLETELKKFRQRGILSFHQFHLLRKNLQDVKLSLNRAQTQVS